MQLLDSNSGTPGGATARLIRAAANHTEVEDQEKAEGSEEFEDSEEDTTTFLFEHYSPTQAQEEEEDNIVSTPPRNS